MKDFWIGFWTIVIFAILGIIYKYIKLMKQAKIECQKEQSAIQKANKYLEQLRIQYDRIYEKHDLENINTYITDIIGNACICWIETGNLYLLSSWQSIYEKVHEAFYYDVDLSQYNYQFNYSSILLGDIEYFNYEGEVYNETKISGGGGGGSSITGAIAGALLAGNTGAIIGSRKERDPIVSENILHDERDTILIYFDEDHQLDKVKFNSEAYNVFLKLMPEKEYKYVMYEKSKTNNEDAIDEKIRKLYNLYKDGIITEEEYIQKKNKLLSQL